jgi:predicted amidohydrolase
MVKIAVVQTRPAFGESARNIREAVGLIEASSADIYVLPELFNTGYNIIDAAEAGQLAEPVDGPTYRAIAEVAKRRSCYIAYGFAENAGRIYNSAALVGPSGLIGLYRKVHLYNRETLLFAPGDVGFPVFELPFGKVGMMICFDWIYPESARTLALRGAQLILHPSNLVMPYCPDAMITRCLENRIFAATANRVGEEERGGVRFSYTGTSEVVSCRGELLCRLDAVQTGVGVAGIDLAEAANKRINEYNDLLLDRRGPQYKL